MKDFHLQSAFRLLLAGIALMAGASAQSNAPGAPVVTTQTAIDSALQGVTGGIAINKFGDVFQASTWEGKVYEFPANGGAPVVLLQYGTDPAYSGKGLAGVAVDANQNLYISTIYVGAQTTTDSAIYEVPYVNGAYPATFTLNAPVAQCGAAPTTVCAWGNFLQATGYYYQGWDFAVDGKGVGYIVTLFDNTGNNNIYACNAACEARTQNGTILAGNLPHPVLSIAADFAGDVFYADGSSSIYEIPTGTSAPITLASSFNVTVGVAVDQAGNLYVTDSQALYKFPRASSGAYPAASLREIAPLAGATVRGYNGGGVAVDLHGNIYAATGYSKLLKLNVDNGIFAAATANSASSTQNFTLTFNKTTTSLTAMPSGGLASDFTLSGNTCAAGGTQGSTCTFTGTFAPVGVGLRGAALALSDSSGNSFTLPLAGVGLGAGLTLDPGTPSTVASGFKQAAGTAVDAAGNIFLADTGANAVYQYTGGTGAPVALGSGLISPTGVAADGAGNLYIADLGGSGAASGRVVEIPRVAGILTTASQTTIATGLGTPQGLTIDGSGTLYIADSTNKNVFVLPQSQFGQTGGATLGTNLTAPTDVAVDASGNVFIADPKGNQVVAISQEGVQTVVGSGFVAPSSIALDASGSVLVADRGNQRIVRVPNEAGLLNANDEVSIYTGITNPYSLRSTPNGSLVVVDNSANTVQLLSRTVGLSTFSSVNVNSTSPSQTIYLSSEGNQPLTLQPPLFTTPAAPFALTNSSCTGASLAAGLTCQLSATFSPTVKGPASTSVALSTSALNTASPKLTLQGTGLFLATPTIALTQSSPSGIPSYGQTVTLSISATGTVANGGTPTGTVALVIDNSLQPSVPLVSGSASLNVPGLSGGAHTITARYSGDLNYAAGQSTVLNLSITPSGSAINLAISGDAVAPLSAASGDAVNFTSTLIPSTSGFFSGTVSFVSGATVLATAQALPGPNGTYTASASSTTIPTGTYQVVAVFGGNANYTGSTSANPIALTVVSVPTLAVTSSSSSITSTASSPGSTKLSITSLAGFQGGVDFSCSSLPANAVCQFNPAVLTLIAGTSGNAVAVPVLTTTLTILVNQAPLVTPTGISPWAGLLLIAYLVILRRGRKALRSAPALLGALCLAVAACFSLSGCGSSTANTPTGSSNVTITATATPSVPATVATTSKNTVSPTLTIGLTVK